MPRLKRITSSTKIYHVWLRGINQQRLFEEAADFEHYLTVLSEVKEVSAFKLFAYCLMDNHIHLLIKEDDESLGQIFKRVGARYVYWFNWKYQRSGHLFQDRFNSRPVESDSDFAAVLSYIYNNPFEAGACSKVEEYRWSSRQHLGSGGLIDESELFSIIPLKEIKGLVSMKNQDELLSFGYRSKRLSDEAAAELMRKLYNIKNTSQIQRLERSQQETVFSVLHEQGVSIRQFARLSGLSKKVVEKMIR